jgi:hypothetical protein
MPSAQVYDTHRREKAVPKLASGLSCFILTRQSWLKYMYAERARLGAFGSFLCEAPRGEPVSCSMLVQKVLLALMWAHPPAGCRAMAVRLRVVHRWGHEEGGRETASTSNR